MSIPRIISVDDHVVEPPDLWSARLPRKFLERGPRIQREKGRFGGASGMEWTTNDSGEWGDKVSEGTREHLNESVEKAKEALKGDDAAILNQARDELMQAFSAAGQEMYQAQAAEAGPTDEDMPDMEDMGTKEEPTDDEAAEGEEEVVEADYEIVDEEK